MKNRKRTAANDQFIELFLAEYDDGENFDVRSNGEIWTTKDAYGHSQPGVWRRAGHQKKEGYWSFTFQISGKRYMLGQHRIVYAKFCGKLDPSLVINHKDSDPSNNNPSNLELVPASLNNTHRFVKNPSPNMGNRSLTQEEAVEVRRLHFEEGVSYPELMKMFLGKLNSKGQISDIINNKTYTGQTSLVEKILNEKAKIEKSLKKIEFWEQELSKEAV